jgi:hypothetical protein
LSGAEYPLDLIAKREIRLFISYLFTLSTKLSRYQNGRGESQNSLWVVTIGFHACVLRTVLYSLEAPFYLRYSLIRSHFSFYLQSINFSEYLSLFQVVRKVKLSRYTPWRRMGERRYSSYSYLTSALDGGEWSAWRPGRALPLRKGPPLPIVQEAGWAPEPVWTQGLEEKSSAPVGDRTPFVQSVVRHYTDWATAAPAGGSYSFKF